MGKILGAKETMKSLQAGFSLGQDLLIFFAHILSAKDKTSFLFMCGAHVTCPYWCSLRLFF